MKDAVFGGQVIPLDFNAESKEAVEFACHQHGCVVCLTAVSSGRWRVIGLGPHESWSS